MAVSTLVVEDDDFTRVTLAESLRANEVDVVLATGEAGEALEVARSRPVHAAFLDLHLGPGPTGIDLALVLRRLHPRIGVVLLTSFDDPRLLSPTLPEAPAGTQYVTKRSVAGIEPLITALRAAVDAAASRSAAPGTTPSGPPVDAPTSALTDTQVETLRLVAQGLTNAEIARRRGVSEGSVEATLTRLARSLGVSPDATRPTTRSTRRPMTRSTRRRTTRSSRAATRRRSRPAVAPPAAPRSCWSPSSCSP